ADRRHGRGRAHEASARRHLRHPVAAPPSRARGRGRDHARPRVQGARRPRGRHRLPSFGLQCIRGADGGARGALRGERRDPAPVLAGRVPEVVQMRDAWVAPTRADADLVYGPHVMTAYRYYWEHRLAEFANMPADTKFTPENLAPDRLILGDPETCVREFQRWQKATGASTFLLRLRHAHSGGPPHDKIMDAIRLFGERVLPYCEAK